MAPVTFQPLQNNREGWVVATDKELLKNFLGPLKVCKRYKPKLGQGNKGEGVSLLQFLDLYGADPFCS